MIIVTVELSPTSGVVIVWGDYMQTSKDSDNIIKEHTLGEIALNIKGKF